LPCLQERLHIYRGEREAQRAWSAKRLYSNLGDKLGDYSCRVINSNSYVRHMLMAYLTFMLNVGWYILIF
jgi:hypothetical protein